MAGGGGGRNEPGGDSGGADLDARDFSNDELNALLDDVIGQNEPIPEKRDCKLNCVTANRQITRLRVLW